MKQLILGRIPDNFNPEIHIPISPSCFIGKEDVFPDFDKLDYINIVSNKHELKKYDDITTLEALSWVNIIAEKYNPKEFNKHDFQFWKTIYYPWLGMVIPWIYRKQLLIQKTIEQYSNIELMVEGVNRDIDLRFMDEIDFINNAIWNYGINQWIFSRVIENTLPNKWQIKYIPIEFNLDKEITKRFSKNSSLKSKIYNILSKKIYRSKGIYGFNLFHEIFFHTLFSIKVPIKNTKEKEEKKYINLINWNFDLLEIIEFLIPESLRNIDFSINNRKYAKGKLINYSNRLYYNLSAKIDASLAKESGELIVSTQHGGHNYGSALTINLLKEIEYKSDYFISWGWDKENRNIIKLPSPLLSKNINSYQKENDSIIMVGTDLIGFYWRFDSFLNDVNVTEYRKNKYLFVKGINNHNNFYYRPYPEKETSYLDSKYLLKKFVEVKIHKGNLHKDLQHCKLLILDHPGTTWNIAMAMNTPLILFWERDHFPFNIKADEYLDKFKKLGIYFEKPEEAAKKVNRLNKKYEDLSIWWNQKEIQELRKEWMWKYARADKNWFWIWTKTLWNLK